MSRTALLVGLLALGVAGLPTATAIAVPDQLTLVSRGYDGRPGTGPWWVSDSVGTSISADGRRVAFISSATNLWQGAPEGEKQVYITVDRPNPPGAPQGGGNGDDMHKANKEVRVGPMLWDDSWDYNEENPIGTHHEEHARTAWVRTLEFLRAHLG